MLYLAVWKNPAYYWQLQLFQNSKKVKKKKTTLNVLLGFLFLMII